MNRVIKFRGKRKDNNNWIYGSFVTGGIFGGPKEDCYIFYDGHFIEVIAETVGQFTGAVDGNGKEIYEGDVYRPVHTSKNVYKVMFISGAFVGGKSEQSCMPLAWEIETDGGKPDIVEHHCKWLEIIGNIHDNPELLNPAGGQSSVNNMLHDPNVKTEEQTAGEAANAEATNEQATQEQAPGSAECETGE